jgi:hypothetical protein
VRVDVWGWIVRPSDGLGVVPGRYTRVAVNLEPHEYPVDVSKVTEAVTKAVEEYEVAKSAGGTRV